MNLREDIEQQSQVSDPHAIAAVLEIVHRATGVDFTSYRPATIRRRVGNRMIAVGVKTLDEYVALVDASPAEVELLAQRLTIKVSRFYRNRAVFDTLRYDLLPRLLRDGGDRPFHIWVAGCGRGEEAYTLAMLLDECGAHGIVEASDIDAIALQDAARGIYPETAVQELPADLVDRYVTPVHHGTGQSYQIVDALRARVRLHAHDLTARLPCPSSRAACALVSCRNVLIYLQREAQGRAFQALLDGLAPRGVLVLGEAEWPPPTIVNTLEVLAPKHRIFRRIDPTSREEQ